ncbi:GNVR domain-containing protein [Eoetvoesiella caeni]
MANKENHDDALYLRGSKALQSELNQLKSRVTDDSFIPELPDLIKNLALLNSINMQPEGFSVARIDRAAVAPEYPVKPRKALSVVMGVILGGFLGIFLALMRKKLKRH